MVEMLLQCVESYSLNPLNVNDVMSWFSFDAMGEVAFGQDFGMMGAREWHEVLIQQERALAMLGPMADVLWIIRAAINFLPFLGKLQDYFRMVTFCGDHMWRRLDVGIQIIESRLNC